jgi:hypothetical protein
LRARCQCAKQQIAGTRASACASDTLVGFRLVNGASEIHRAGYRNIRLSALCAEGDARGAWVTAVLILQRFLQRSKIHGNLIIFILGHLLLPGTASAELY